MSSFAELTKKWNSPIVEPRVSQMIALAARPERVSPWEAAIETSRKRQRELDLTDLRLPKEALPSGKGRGRTFEIRRVPGRVVELTEALLMTINTDAKSMTSLVLDFEKFHSLNPRRH
jgi:hypothetical protein